MVFCWNFTGNDEAIEFCWNFTGIHVDKDMKYFWNFTGIDKALNVNLLEAVLFLEKNDNPTNRFQVRCAWIQFEEDGYQLCAYSK